MKINITYAILLFIFFVGLGLYGVFTLKEIELIPLAAVMFSGYGLGWLSNVEIEK